MIMVTRVGESGIFADENSFITFLNSPFISHRELKAIDIFPNSRNFVEIRSPVSGKIIYHKVHIMRKNSMPEHVTIIDAGDVFVKLLHVEPYFVLNEKIEVGEILGKLYKSPYFRPWTDPHIHIELRPRNDFLRARGGLKINIDNCSPEGKFIPLDEYIQYDTYILRKIKPIKCGKFYGAGDFGIIDGGYPHYGYGLLIGTENPVLMGERIGEILEDHIIKFYDKEIFLNGKKMRGMGFYVYLNENAFIKYIQL